MISDWSNTTARWVGASGAAFMSTSNFQSMLQKPWIAPTGRPSDLRVSGGRAWKARKMNPDPSTR